MNTFADLGLAEPILKAVLAEGYETPTPIQQQAIPQTLAGQDILGIAQTGTGKTAAFVLPQLHAMAEAPQKPMAMSAKVLILAPTRELTQQIADAIRAYGRAIKPSIAIIIGGVKPGPQVKAMTRGVDFIVATPGRLLDHMQTGAITLKGVQTVVLDEADQMLDLGFLPAINKIMAKLPDERQTQLFSATMPKPIRALADEFLRDPVEVSVAPASRPIERIDQSVAHVERGQKVRLLAKLLRDDAVVRAVVFTRTKHGANKLCQQLENVGIAAKPIHGNKSQAQRDKTLAAFKKGFLSVLVATDIAARGIDIDDVTHVFNFDLPNVPEVYVHRIGRTARAGNSGVAVSFCTAAERPLLRDIEKLIKSELPLLGAIPGAYDPARAEVTNNKDAAQNAKRDKLKDKNDQAAKASSKRRRQRKKNKPAAVAETKPIAEVAGEGAEKKDGSSRPKRSTWRRKPKRAPGKPGSFAGKGPRRKSGKPHSDRKPKEVQRS